MIASLPYINTRAHLKEMMRRFDLYMDMYNAEVAKMEGGKKFTLKATHRAFYKDLVLETGKRMLARIKVYQRIQREQGDEQAMELLAASITGDDFYACTTNRVALASHNRKDKTTIYRNIQRLLDAGILVNKVYHGAKRNFDILIDSDFLLVSDEQQPEFNPVTMGRDFSQEVAFCKLKKNIQEHLKYKINGIEPVDNSADATVEHIQQTQQEQLRPGEIAVLERLNELSTRSFTGTEEMQGKVAKIPTETERRTDEIKKLGGGAPGREASIQDFAEHRGIDKSKVIGNLVRENGKFITKSDPKSWHAFHRLAHSVYFVNYLIDRIYTHRGITIHPGARIKAIQYVEDFYFPDPLATSEKLTENGTHTPFTPCQTLEQMANRLSGLKWCVDAANRHAIKKNGFFPMPLRYIDIENENGLRGTFAWFRKQQNADVVISKSKKNKDDFKKLHQLIRNVIENPSYTELLRAEETVRATMPRYIYLFQSSVNMIRKNLDNITNN